MSWHWYRRLLHNLSALFVYDVEAAKFSSSLHGENNDHVHARRTLAIANTSMPNMFMRMHAARVPAHSHPQLDELVL